MTVDARRWDRRQQCRETPLDPCNAPTRPSGPRAATNGMVQAKFFPLYRRASDVFDNPRIYPCL